MLQSVTAGRSGVDGKTIGRRAVDQRLCGSDVVSFFQDAEQVSDCFRGFVHALDRSEASSASDGPRSPKGARELSHFPLRDASEINSR